MKGKLFTPICDSPSGGECYPGDHTRYSGFTAMDMFAGAGGSTSGAESAGANVVWAINHWDLAIAVHYYNHRNVTHCCENAFDFDWRQAPLTRLILSSPSCQSFSPAATRNLEKGRRGTAPGHDMKRATAWAVPRCLEVMARRAEGEGEPFPIVIMENTPNFVKWPGFEGVLTYIRNIPPGYSTATFMLNAKDFGVPQDRNRVFVVATPSNKPFDFKFKPQEPVPFRTCISKRQDLEWIPLKDWPTKTVREFALYKKSLFSRMDRKVPEVWAWQNTTDTLPTDPADPIRTITYKSGGQWYMMRSTSRGDEMRMFTVDEFRKAMGFPSNYALPDSAAKAVALLGNAVAPPVVTALVKQIMRRA